MALPTITVNFKSQAASAISRSAQGILCVVIAETAQADNYAVYHFTSAAEVQASSLTSGNKTLISRAFEGTAPAKVTVVATKAAVLSSSTVGAALDDVSFNWVCSNSSANQAVLAAYVAGQTNRTIKACVVNTASNSDHVLDLADQTVALKAGGTATMLSYVTRIAAICAACPITGSITYTALEEVSGVTGAIGEKQTGIYKDDNMCRLSKGVMSSGAKVAVIEAKDILTEDIVLNFKNNYLGKRRNSPANQALFVADVIGYLNDLAAQGVLNSESTLYAEVDVETMRTRWMAAGVDVSSLTDAQVKNKPYQSYVFVTVTCSILDAMEDMVVNITLE